MAEFSSWFFCCASKNHFPETYLLMTSLQQWDQSFVIVSIINVPHCLYRILDSKKTSRFQYSIPGLLEIHRNLKQPKNFNSRDGFFRKSPFCTFSCINPGFGGPWDMLWIFFLIGIFIMLQKNTFGQKKIQISCMGSKVPFWQKWKIFFW